VLSNKIVNNLRKYFLTLYIKFRSASYSNRTLKIYRAGGKGNEGKIFSSQQPRSCGSFTLRLQYPTHTALLSNSFLQVGDWPRFSTKSLCLQKWCDGVNCGILATMQSMKIFNSQNEYRPLLSGSYTMWHYTSLQKSEERSVQIFKFWSNSVQPILNSLLTLCSMTERRGSIVRLTFLVPIQYNILKGPFL